MRKLGWAVNTMSTHIYYDFSMLPQHQSRQDQVPQTDILAIVGPLGRNFYAPMEIFAGKTCCWKETSVVNAASKSF